MNGGERSMKKKMDKFIIDEINRFRPVMYKLKNESVSLDIIINHLITHLIIEIRKKKNNV